MKFLDFVSDFQFKHSGLVIIIALLVSLFLGFGLFNVGMQSDMDKMMPQDLDIYKLSDRIKDNFGGQDASFVLLRIEDSDKGGVYDIRDPLVVRFLVELEEELSGEDLIESVGSVGNLFGSETIPGSLAESRQIFNSVPGVENYFSRDYSATMVMISSDLGGGEEKIKELEEIISEAVSRTAKPDGLKIYVTGTPQIRSMILDLLVKDAVFTLLFAAVIIFLLLIVIERNFNKALLIFLPLTFGIFWTLGSMGWLGIKLSIATVGIGAMILGLGVEYGVFIVSRYNEERVKNDSQISLRIAVRDVGGSVLGSGTTTVTGFLALTFSMMPVMRDLGLSLALGITFSLIAAVFVNPAVIVSEERFVEWRKSKGEKNEI